MSRGSSTLRRVVPLLNPLEIVNGGKAKRGASIALDMQGLGIRSIERGRVYSSAERVCNIPAWRL